MFRGGGVVCRADEEIAKRKLWTQVPSRLWGEDLTMIVSRRTGCRVVQWIVHARCVRLPCAVLVWPLRSLYW